MIRSFRRMLKRAGLTHRRLYDLLHIRVSLLLVQGVHSGVVTDILGHSQISLTMNIYSHAIPELQQEAATRLDDPRARAYPSGALSYAGGTAADQVIRLRWQRLSIGRMARHVQRACHLGGPILIHR